MMDKLMEDLDGVCGTFPKNTFQVHATNLSNFHFICICQIFPIGQRSVFYGPGLLIVFGGSAPLLLWAEDDTGDHWLNNVTWSICEEYSFSVLFNNLFLGRMDLGLVHWFLVSPDLYHVDTDFLLATTPVPQTPTVSWFSKMDIATFTMITNITFPDRWLEQKGT